MAKRIPAFRLKPIPMEEAASNLPGFEWAEDDVGKRHQLGGEPGFIQHDEGPKCPECGESMTFLAQIDSINDEFCLADCGLVFVFVCFGCVEVKAFIQSY